MDRSQKIECPEFTLLEKFLDEQLSPPQSDDVDAHVAECEACQSLLDGLVDRMADGVLGSMPQSPIAKWIESNKGGVAAKPICSHAVVRKESSDHELPETVGGHAVMCELGRGSYGVVYQAWDVSLDRYVAIKVPHRRVINRLGGATIYLREARTLAALDHPNIVRVHEARESDNGTCYIVSQFVDGPSLEERLVTGSMHYVDAARMMTLLAHALQHAHERGVYHRDLKPANILVDEADRPYLADFGLAMNEQDIGKGPHFLGTPAYMSPEQARREGHLVDGRSDIFSLGVVFFKMLTGRRPFLSESTEDLVKLITDVDAPSVRQKNGAIPKELDRICAKALARQLSDRYSSAKDLADDLQAWLDTYGGLPIHARRRQAALRTTANCDADSSTLIDEGAGGFQRSTLLGRGGMGTVYRAWQTSADREVALKYLEAGDEKAQARFLNEVRALGRVQHPHLVRIYTSGSDDERSYYAMELVEGVDLSHVLEGISSEEKLDADDASWSRFIGRLARQSRKAEVPVGAGCRLDEVEESAAETSRAEATLTTEICRQSTYQRRIASMVRDIAGATGELHAANIVHRDIKPDNIRLASDGNRAVLMDLGIAKLASQNDHHVTQTREFVGSLRYASPEQIIDASKVDHRADIYSLGATLWELLTIQPLYGIDRNVNDSRAMLKIQVEEPAPIRKFNPTIAGDLQAITQKCLEKDPSRRYQSAQDLVEDLTSFLDGRPVKARRIGAIERAVRRCRRRPVITGLATSVVLLGVMLMTLLIPWPEPKSNKIRVSIKPWVGFSPLVVADELGLCDDVDVELVPVRDTTDVRQKILSKELDAATYLIDSHTQARANRTPVKIVLQLDVSGSADAMVVREEIRTFDDLRGKTIAYMHHEAPHYLLLSLCEKHGLATTDFKHRKVDSAKEAVDLFVAGEADAVVSYDPFLSAAMKIPGAHTLANAADDRGSIIDILTVREEFLESDREKVEKLIAGWMQAVELLRTHDPRAIEIACRFLGSKDAPVRADEYVEMAKGMRYSGIGENLKFFRAGSTGVNEFQTRFDTAQDRWDRHGQLKRKTNPAEGDSSYVFMEMYGP